MKQLATSLQDVAAKKKNVLLKVVSMKFVPCNITFCESTYSDKREIKTRVYGKRQTEESRLRFLKINNKHTRIV